MGISSQARVATARVTSRRVTRLGSTAAACTLAVALVAAPARAEPFLTRNQHPLVALFGLPPPLPARIAAAGSTTAGLQWSNFAATGSDGPLAYTLDGEIVDARVSVDRPLGRRLALHAEIAHRSLGAGALDGMIEGWHDTFGLPDGSRRRLPEDELLLEYRDAEQVLLRVDRSASGLADVPIALGWQWHDTADVALAAWLTVKAPVGSVDDLTGSGAWDGAASLAVDVALAGHWHWFGQASLASLGRGDLLPALQESSAWSVMTGVSWNAWRGLDLTAQVEANSAVFDTGLDDLDGDATVLTFGGSWHTAGGWRFDLGVSEDVDVDASPDVVLNLAVRKGY